MQSKYFFEEQFSLLNLNFITGYVINSAHVRTLSLFVLFILLQWFFFNLYNEWKFGTGCSGGTDKKYELIAGPKCIIGA